MREQIHHTPLGDIHYWIRRTDECAPWLVFLPGLSADHMLFEKQLAYFCGKYNCFVWDAPAHALSRPFRLEFTMRDLAAYLHAIFEKEGISRPVLVGQSLGGYISQAYMDAYPGEAAGFVSIDSCPMSRKYYTWWELALLKRTKWMYLSIPHKLLIRWGVWGTATTAYGRALMEKMWSSYGKQEFCALADHPVGLDAEETDRQINLGLADKILSPKEKDRYLSAGDRRTALLKLWVLKEAAAKLSGEGLRGYPNHTDFSPDDPKVRELGNCFVALLEE